jgi:hypothetical protein
VQQNVTDRGPGHAEAPSELSGRPASAPQLADLGDLLRVEFRRAAPVALRARPDRGLRQGRAGLGEVQARGYVQHSSDRQPALPHGGVQRGQRCR